MPRRPPLRHSAQGGCKKGIFGAGHESVSVCTHAARTEVEKGLVMIESAAAVNDLAGDAERVGAEFDAANRLSDYCWDRRCKTIYRVRLSVLYHLKRERFFDGLDKACSIITAVAATASVGVILKSSASVDVTVAAIAAVLSLVPVVFNPADKARKHGQAAAEFRRLLAECERAGERWGEQACDQFAGRVVELEASEPAPLSALVLDCQNQLAIASGKPEDRVTLTWFERWFKHWLDFDASLIEARQRKSA